MNKASSRHRYGSNVPSPDNPASPLTPASVVDAFARYPWSIPSPVVLAATESTNDEALRLAADGAAEWTAVVADQQTAGRGRLGRTWESTPGRALLFSVVLRPDSEWAPTSLGWIPLIAGMAIASAARSHHVAAALKWPNDVVVDGQAHDGSAGPRKLCGILAERRDGAVIVGVGINVHHRQSELPIPAATSCAIEGVAPRRSDFLAQCLDHWMSLWQDFRANGGDADGSGIRDAYLAQSATVGRHVRVDLGGGTPLVGEAVDVDPQGRLVVESLHGRQPVSAGDVTHLRH